MRMTRVPVVPPETIAKLRSVQQDPHTFPEFSNRPPPHCFLRVLPSPLAIHRLHRLSFRHFPTTESWSKRESPREHLRSAPPASHVVVSFDTFPNPLRNFHSSSIQSPDRPDGEQALHQRQSLALYPSRPRRMKPNPPSPSMTPTTFAVPMIAIPSAHPSRSFAPTSPSQSPQPTHSTHRLWAGLRPPRNPPNQPCPVHPRPVSSQRPPHEIVGTHRGTHYGPCVNPIVFPVATTDLSNPNRPYCQPSPTNGIVHAVHFQPSFSVPPLPPFCRPCPMYHACLIPCPWNRPLLVNRLGNRADQPKQCTQAFLLIDLHFVDPRLGTSCFREPVCELVRVRECTNR